MTRLVVQALVTQDHEVVVVRTEDISCFEAPTHAFGVEIVRWDNASQVEALARTADALVYQIGDNYQFHCGCLEWLPVLSGIICLHDYFLGHLFYGWSKQRRPQARAIIRTWYSEALTECYSSDSNSEEFIEKTGNAAPMTEWVTSMANGVVTHSSWDIQRVLNACPGPVYAVPLAYDARGLVHRSLSNPQTSNNNFTVLTLGHINSNKRPHSVIRAIGNSPKLRKKALYRLVGPIKSVVAQELIALAKSLKVKISISGEVDEASLIQAMEQADVVCCLRLPPLEAASASAIEAMLYGKAVIVMDTGFYRELPDRYVRKIVPEQELGDLQRELEFLYLNPTERYEIGQDAMEWATLTFNVDNYASKLIAMCSSVAKAVPTIEAIRYFTQTYARWGVSDALATTPDTIAPLHIFAGASHRIT